VVPSTPEIEAIRAKFHARMAELLAEGLTTAAAIRQAYMEQLREDVCPSCGADEVTGCYCGLEK